MTSDNPYGINSLPLVLTAQERFMIGASALTDNESSTPADWYRPQGLLNKRVSLEEVIKEREKLGGYVTSEIIGAVLGLDKPIVLKLAQIDPETGQTLEDPKIIGLWDKRRKKVIRKKEGPELTLKAYEVFQASGYDLHLRSRSHDVESGGSGGAERE